MKSVIQLYWHAAGITLSAAIAFAAEPGGPAAKPTIAKICTNCHKAEPNTVQGYFDSVAFKAKTIQVKIDDATELIKFDEDEIKVVNGAGKTGDGEFLKDNKIKKGHEIKVEYVLKRMVSRPLSSWLKNRRSRFRPRC